MNQGFLLRLHVPAHVFVEKSQIYGFELRVELFEVATLNKTVYFRKNISKVQSGCFLVDLRLRTARGVVYGFAVVEKLLEVAFCVLVLEL